MLVAISELVKDVVIPVLAAVITAVGIVVPLWVQRRRDREAETDAYQKALRSIYRDAAFLVEQVQVTALRHTQGEAVAADQLAATVTATTRLFSRLFDDPRVFDSYFHGPGKPAIENETKLLLLLGELEVRLRRLATSDGILLTLFAAQLVMYFGEEDEQRRRELKEALGTLVKNDREAQTFAAEVCPALLGSSRLAGTPAVDRAAPLGGQRPIGH